jgi:hypothetical protein
MRIEAVRFQKPNQQKSLRPYSNLRPDAAADPDFRTIAEINEALISLQDVLSRYPR